MPIGAVSNRKDATSKVPPPLQIIQAAFTYEYIQLASKAIQYLCFWIRAVAKQREFYWVITNIIMQSFILKLTYKT